MPASKGQNRCFNARPGRTLFTRFVLGTAGLSYNNMYECTYYSVSVKGVKALERNSLPIENISLNFSLFFPRDRRLFRADSQGTRHALVLARQLRQHFALLPGAGAKLRAQRQVQADFLPGR